MGSKNIYFFVEHYPTPYKPYYDTQFISFLKKGWDVKVFAYGKYDSTINQEIIDCGLMEKIFYYPAAITYSIKYIVNVLLNVLKSPVKRVVTMMRIFDGEFNVKNNMFNMFISALLPDDAPNICFVHNLSIASTFTFLNDMYPDSKVVMFYHGGEVTKKAHITNPSTIFGKYKTVLTNTEYSKNHAIQYGCDPEKVSLCPVGFNVEEYVPDTEKEYFNDNLIKILSIGRISEEKGFEYSIRAIGSLLEKGYKNIRYHIVGDGNKIEYLKDLCDKLKLNDSVIFLGEKSRSEVIKALKETDILIIPSIDTVTWSETQGCVVQEALMMKLIVVSTRTGGLTESISDNMKDYMVRPFDSDAIAEQIQRICDLDKKTLQNLGSIGREFVLNKYDVEKITDLTIEIVKYR